MKSVSHDVGHRWLPASTEAVLTLNKPEYRLTERRRIVADLGTGGMILRIDADIPTYVAGRYVAAYLAVDVFTTKTGEISGMDE